MITGVLIKTPRSSGGIGAYAANRFFEIVLRCFRLFASDVEDCEHNSCFIFVIFASVTLSLMEYSNGT